MPADDAENKKTAKDGATVGAGEQQVDKMDKEIREQEKLIAGYQQENKRLYDQLRNIQKHGKSTEDRMFKENQKMATEIANMRYMVLKYIKYELRRLVSMAQSQLYLRGFHVYVSIRCVVKSCLS